MPRVSVVIPVYGVEQFVEVCVRSVLEQSYEDFEVIIVNDKSPDRSLEICESIDDPRIRIVTHLENRGLAGARNTGIRHAKGEYIALLDSDDLWEKNKLEAHVEHLDANPKVGVSFSRSAFIDEQGTHLNTYQMPKLTDISVAHLMCRNPVGNGSAPVIRREVFEEIATMENIHGIEEPHFFDDSFRQSEDIECWIRIAATTEWQFEGL
jgi:glycosyltransferase involved in cell wall biosynthesis